MDVWDVLLVNCFNSADIKLSLVSSHRTLSSSHYHLIIILLIIIIISSYRCISTRRDYLRGGLGARSEAWSGQAQLLGRYVCPMDYLHSLTHMHPFIHTSIHSYIHPYIHTYIDPSIHPSTRLSIHFRQLLPRRLSERPDVWKRHLRWRGQYPV